MISEWVTRAIIGGGLDRKTEHDCYDCYECCDAHIQHALVIGNPALSGQQVGENLMVKDTRLR
jgi:hypothetical protein